MAEKKVPSGDTKKATAAENKTTRKPRKHGYRGYGSGLGKDSASYGGRVLIGGGFAGVEPLTGAGESLLKPDLLTDELKERVPKPEEKRSKVPRP
jgi:hypothetical protein